MTSPTQTLISQLGLPQGAAVWDLSGEGPSGKDNAPEAFLAARSAARGSAADAVVLGAKGGEPAALYRQIMTGGLLKPGGLLLLQAPQDAAMAPLLAMIDADVAAAVLRRRETDAQRDGAVVVELDKGWSAGMPTPSLCGPAIAGEDSAGLRNRKGGEQSSSSPAAAGAPAEAAAAPAAAKEEEPSAMQNRLRTVSAIAFLWACAPMLALLALVAWVRHRVFGPAFKKGSPKKQLRVLVTGGKMSKASAVARAVGRDGHKVFTAEILPYRFCHTRYCTYVEKHYVLPRPTVQPKEWEAAVQAIVKEQNIDVIIPCTAPVESSAYAHLRERLPSHVRVFAFDGETSDELDNKYTFNQVLVKAGLPCPETANMECTEDAIEFFKRKEGMPDDGKKYIVKPSVYDPKARTEILFLPIDDKQKQLEYLKSRNARKECPYVIQEVLQNPEFGCYAIFNKGALTGFEFFESAASCLVYRQHRGKHYDAALELNKGLGKAMNLTGQLTLDLMYNSAGELVPIECNPRIHSAVCTMEGHEFIGASLAEAEHVPKNDAQIVTSNPTTFRYWTMDQLFLMAGFWKPKNCFKLSLGEMLTGTDAILCGDDPMPFLAMYLVQIPSLLLLEILPATPWLKVDFCIGKIVKEGGD